MRRMALADLAIVLALATANPAAALTGGPDAFGYDIDDDTPPNCSCGQAPPSPAPWPLLGLATLTLYVVRRRARS